MEPVAPIAIVLPMREGFSPSAFGAVSLCVRDFSLHSHYLSRIRVLGGRSETPFEGVHYQAVKPRRYFFESATRGYVRSLLAQFKMLKPALIEVHNRPNIALALSRKTHMPIALHLHNDPLEMRFAKTAAERQTLVDRCTAIYCISDWVKSRFAQGLSHGTEKLHTVPIGTDITPSTIPKEKLVLYVGRITPNKGVVEYAQALREILPRFPHWRGMCIGGRRHSVSTEYSEYEEEVLDNFERTGNQAIYAGFQTYEETMQAMAKASIMVIPSRWEEPFGRTAIEALAHGCAIITSGSGGLREIVGDDALMVPNASATQIADALQTLLANPDQLADMQMRARNRAPLFALQPCCDRLDAIRRQLLST